MNAANILTIANLLLVIGGIIGGYIVLRSAIAKAESDVQDRVRDALSTENALLRTRIDRLEHENRRLSRLMQLLMDTLKKTQHIEVDIDENMITLRTQGGSVSRITYEAS